MVVECSLRWTTLATGSLSTLGSLQTNREQPFDRKCCFLKINVKVMLHEWKELDMMLLLSSLGVTRQKGGEGELKVKEARLLLLSATVIE